VLRAYARAAKPETADDGCDRLRLYSRICHSPTPGGYVRGRAGAISNEGGRSARASGCARLDEVGRLTRPRFDANLRVIRCWVVKKMIDIPFPRMKFISVNRRLQCRKILYSHCSGLN
jgi:hypothetical protein